MLKEYIRKHERGLLVRRGDVVDVLRPGVYRRLSRLYAPGRDRIERRSILAVSLEHENLAILVREPRIAEHLEVLELEENERAIVWVDGRLHAITGPGLTAYWRDAGDIVIERYDVDEDIRLDHGRLEAVLASPQAERRVQVVDVPAGSRVVLTRNGEIVETLGAGRHAYWRGVGELAVLRYELRESKLDVSGQDVMTADRVTLRLNLHVGYRVVDVLKAATAVDEYQTTLYRDAQLALRRAVGARKLDVLLRDKDALGDEIGEALAERVGVYGLAIESAGVRDVILPGDMRELLNRVIEAEKEAEANVIRRREETSAARSQANTAKLLEANPTLARLKELEMLQEILAGSDTTLVLGEGDVLGRLRGLIGGSA